MAKKANGANIETIEKVKQLIYDTCLALDEGKWDEWLDRCDEKFYYKITSYSPEVRKDLMYLDGSREHIKDLCDMLPFHNTDHSPFHRHATVYKVEVSKDGKTATAVTSFVCYRNMFDSINSHLDSGENHLFAVGKYYDTISLEGDTPRFLEREARLETRRLDKGTHYPV